MKVALYIFFLLLASFGLEYGAYESMGQGSIFYLYLVAFWLCATILLFYVWYILVRSGWEIISDYYYYVFFFVWIAVSYHTIELWSKRNHCYKDISRNADLSGCSYRKYDLSNLDLSGANLENTNLNGAILTNSNLSDADLTKSTLIASRLEGANLERTIFCGADLQRSILRRANLTGTDLTNADLRGADISGSILTKVKLENARLEDIVGLTNTMLSEVLGIPQHQIPEALKRMDIRLDSKNSIQKAIKAVCNGNKITEAADYKADNKFHPILSNKYKIPDTWKPIALRFAELVLCVKENKVLVQRCDYYGGSSITRYRYDLYISLMEANTASIIQQHVVHGEDPPECPAIAPSSQRSINGRRKRIKFEDVSKLLNLDRVVNPPEKQKLK